MLPVCLLELSKSIPNLLFMMASVKVQFIQLQLSSWKCDTFSFCLLSYFHYACNYMHLCRGVALQFLEKNVTHLELPNITTFSEKKSEFNLKSYNSRPNFLRLQFGFIIVLLVYVIAKEII